MNEEEQRDTRADPNELYIEAADNDINFSKYGFPSLNISQTKYYRCSEGHIYRGSGDTRVIISGVNTNGTYETLDEYVFCPFCWIAAYRKNIPTMAEITEEEANEVL